MEIPKRDFTRIQESREMWKGRALKFSRERRKITEKTRSVNLSREKWKTRYLKLYEENEDLKKKLQIYL